MCQVTKSLIHLIPCALCPTRATPIKVGPVKFIYAKSFNRNSYNVSEDLIEFTFQDFDELINTRSGDWVAEVRLPLTDTKDQTHANLIVDIALGGLQAALELPQLDNAHRLTSRAAPTWYSELCITEGGGSLPSFHNNQPGLVVVTFQSRLYDNKNLISCIGNRISEFANPETKFPKLNEAWCTAAYWYHQALAEPVETIRIIKLVTAIEILLCTESTKGSQSKIAEAIGHITGLGSKEKIKSDKTVEQFAKLIVQTRSRVLHGTYSTFSSADEMAEFNDVEWIARTLLTTLCQKIEDYQSSPTTIDGVKAMLAFGSST